MPARYPGRNAWIIKELRNLLASGYSIWTAAAALDISYEKAKRLASRYDMVCFTTGHAAIEAAAQSGIVPYRPPKGSSHRPRNLGPQIARLVGERVREMRRRCSATQGDLVLNAGLWRNTIQRIESGTVCPTLPMLYYLARYLGCSIYDLIPESLPDHLFEVPARAATETQEASAGPADSPGSS